MAEERQAKINGGTKHRKWNRGHRHHRSPCKTPLCSRKRSCRESNNGSGSHSECYVLNHSDATAVTKITASVFFALTAPSLLSRATRNHSEIKAVPPTRPGTVI